MFYYVLYIKTKIKKIVLNKQLTKIKFIVKIFQKVFIITKKNVNVTKFDATTNATIIIKNSKKEVEI